MTNETKDLLMQYLYRFAEHYKIDSAANTSFKKRADLLDLVKSVDHNAWVIISQLFDAFIKEDRITNDKEKYEKARPLWESEHAAAEKEKVRTEMELIRFCKEQGIMVGHLNTLV